MYKKNLGLHISEFSTFPHFHRKNMYENSPLPTRRDTHSKNSESNI